MRAHSLNNPKTRSKKRDVNNKGSARITLYLEPIVYSEIKRIALERVVSFNEVANTFIEGALQEEIDEQRIKFLKPMIESAIKKERGRFVN